MRSVTSGAVFRMARPWTCIARCLAQTHWVGTDFEARFVYECLKSASAAGQKRRRRVFRTRKWIDWEIELADHRVESPLKNASWM